MLLLIQQQLERDRKRRDEEYERQTIGRPPVASPGLVSFYMGPVIVSTYVPTPIHGEIEDDD